VYISDNIALNYSKNEKYFGQKLLRNSKNKFCVQ